MLDPNPQVMGILNLTPDSFYDGNSFLDTQTAVNRVNEMISEGATIIDIGGESTRPHCTAVDADTEWNRVKDVLLKISKYKTLTSIDTYKLQVAELALQNGVNIINDISTFSHLEDVLQLAKKYSADVIVTHNSRGIILSDNEKLMHDIISKFYSAIDTAKKYHIDDQKLIFDIGLGFGKNSEQCMFLIKNLKKIRQLFSQRFLIGASRKSFMHEFGECCAIDRLPCTLATTISTYLSGCNIFRAHDVKPNVEVLKFAQKIYGN